MSIKYKNYEIFTNEIISSKAFLELYEKEKILKEFTAKITTSSARPFATFLTKDRKLTNIKEDSLVVLRVVKDNKKFEFITKIRKWGRFSILKEVIRRLSIRNHENVNFEMIEENEKSNFEKDNFIDLSKIDAKIIYRENDFITVYKEGMSPITLQRFIEMSSELVELCFLIHGDGHYGNKFYFVNKSPELHRFVISEFERIFKIPKDIWRARLLFNNPSNSETAKEKWNGLLGLKEEQFYPSISKSVLKTSENGNLRICIDKTIVSFIFRCVFDRIKNINGNLALNAINGLLCAEGSAIIETGGLHKITLSFSQKEKEMFRNLLAKAEIEKLTHISENRMFIVSSWENHYEFFKKFFSNDVIPFSLHNGRCKNALSGFLNHRFTQTIYKYLDVLNRKETFTINELVDKMKHLPNSILNSLRKSRFKKFVNIEGRGVNRNPLIISITQEGKDFIKLVNNIQEAYNGYKLR